MIASRLDRRCYRTRSNVVISSISIVLTYDKIDTIIKSCRFSDYRCRNALMLRCREDNFTLHSSIVRRAHNHLRYPDRTADHDQLLIMIKKSDRIGIKFGKIDQCAGK